MALAPENTLAAFEVATEAGLTYLETDVRVSADGVALAFHDATLERVTNLSGPTSAKTWKQLATTLVHGVEPIARIEDVLGAFPEACFTIDVKEEAAILPLVAAIRRTNSARRVCVAGGFNTWLEAIHAAGGPGLTKALGWQSLVSLYACAQTGVRPPRALRTGEFMHAAFQVGPWALLRRRRFAQRVINMAHDLNIRVIAWTIDEPAEVARLLDQGADGIISDDPRRLVRTLDSLGLGAVGGAAA